MLVLGRSCRAADGGWEGQKGLHLLLMQLGATESFQAEKWSDHSLGFERLGAKERLMIGKGWWVVVICMVRSRKGLNWGDGGSWEGSREEPGDRGAGVAVGAAAGRGGDERSSGPWKSHTAPPRNGEWAPPGPSLMVTPDLLALSPKLEGPHP